MNVFLLIPFITNFLFISLFHRYLTKLCSKLKAPSSCREDLDLFARSHRDLDGILELRDAVVPLIVVIVNFGNAVVPQIVVRIIVPLVVSSAVSHVREVTVVSHYVPVLTNWALILEG